MFTCINSLILIKTLYVGAIMARLDKELSEVVESVFEDLISLIPQLIFKSCYTLRRENNKFDGGKQIFQRK